MKVMKQLLQVPCLEFLLEVTLQGKTLTTAGRICMSMMDDLEWLLHVEGRLRDILLRMYHTST